MVIYDQYGRAVKEIHEQRRNIDLNELPTGIYYIRIESNGVEVGREKLMIN